MAGLTIDVKIRTIQTLIAEIQSGKYMLPSFQRQYVWDEDDIRALIDSIINNYPIGSIILWKPSSASTSATDPFSIPLIDLGNKKSSEVFYVIDGQQRLTSLLLLFNNWKITRDGEEVKISTPISYNPSNWQFYKSATRGIDLSKLVNAFCLQDIQTLADLAKTTPKDSLDQMKERIRKILDYPLPIYVMETFDENEDTFKSMAEAFIRVNRYGVRIGNLELMLSFLAGSISGELKQRTKDLYETCYSLFETDLQPIIRFAFSNFGLKQTQISKVEQFKKNIATISGFKPESANEIFDQCKKSMTVTIDLLKAELGITNSSLLPSQTPLVTLSAYLYRKKTESLKDLDGEDLRRIVDWFILVSFNGYYSSQTDTKLDKDVEIVKTSTLFPFEKLLDNMQIKKARIKIGLADIQRGLNSNVLRVQGRAYLFLLYVILVKQNADDWNGVLLGKRNLGELARHIFSRRNFSIRTFLWRNQTQKRHVSIISQISPLFTRT